MEIKEYKPLALVFYIDWDGNRSALPLDETKIQDFKKALETSKMVELEWVIINTFDIKEIRPSTHTSELEKYFYSKSIEDRAKIKNRAFKRTWDRKQNVIEIISQIPKAIERIEQMLYDQKKFDFEKDLPTIWKDEMWENIIDTEKLTEKQKEIIRTKFQEIKERLSKSI